MNLPFCSLVGEIEAALREGRWPDRVNPELRTHAASCGHCRQLVLVASALRQARQATVPMAHLVSPGTLWWKAQLQRQRLLMERSVKPVLVAEKAALATALLGVIGLATWGGSHLSEWLGLSPSMSLGAVSEAAAPLGGGDGITWLLPLALITGLLGVLAGLAAFLVARTE